MKAKKILWIIIFLIFFSCFMISGWKIFKYYMTSYQAEKAIEKVFDKVDETAVGSVEEITEAGEPIEIDARYVELYRENPDFYGWIRIEDTPVDYPVMYTPKDPEFYLHANFEKEYEYSGLPFVDARCSISPRSENLIIYGHNMKSEKMFSAIEKYKQKEYYEKHPVILFDTILEGSATYQIVYVIKTDWYSDIYDFIDTDTSIEFETIKDELESQILYDTGMDVTEEDQLIMLSTCEYSVENGRMIVIAKKI